MDERVHRQCEAVGHVAAQEVAHAEAHVVEQVEAHVEVVVIDIFNDEVCVLVEYVHACGGCVADMSHTDTTQTSDGIEMGGSIWKVWQ